MSKSIATSLHVHISLTKEWFKGSYKDPNAGEAVLPDDEWPMKLLQDTLSASKNFRYDQESCQELQKLPVLSGRSRYAAELLTPQTSTMSNQASWQLPEAAN
jgi:hypothetical protein